MAGRLYSLNITGYNYVDSYLVVNHAISPNFYKEEEAICPVIGSLTESKSKKDVIFYTVYQIFEFWLIYMFLR